MASDDSEVGAALNAVAGGTDAGSPSAGSPSPPPPPEPLSENSQFGQTTEGVASLRLSNGEGSFFQVRTGPNYKKHGKKTASASHIYSPVSIDLFKRESICFHTASQLRLPPPPDATAPNETGLPRRLVVNAIVPADAPAVSFRAAPVDGPCYQIVVVFEASAADLARWQAGGSAAVRLFERFVREAPEGATPSGGDLDVKERLKIIPYIDNAKTVGLGPLEGYNGKPALITKSGSVFRGPDYLELGMNTFRFGFLTRKGMHHLLPRLAEFQLHVGLVLEGRDDAELDEQIFASCKLTGLDLKGIATPGALPPNVTSAATAPS